MDSPLTTFQADEAGEEDEEDDDEEEEEPAPKKASLRCRTPVVLLTPSLQAKKEKKKEKQEEGESDVEIVEGLSGDEVDHHLIIPGGRGTRRGRGGPAKPQFNFKPAKRDGSDSDDL